MQRKLIIQNSATRPGFLGYLMIGLWFLLTIIASAKASEPVTLKASDILPDIEAALSERGMPEGAEITLVNPDQAFVTTGAVEIGHMSYNARSGRFVVRLANTPAAFAGVARVIETYAVLTRPVARGEIIAEADIAYRESAGMRAGQYIRDAAALIGKEARRPLGPDTPLRSSDVAAPVLIKKGALVTVTYAAEGLRLTHQAVAMNAGAAGDVISIQNIQSERTLKGVVAGENLVRVAAPRAPQTNLEG
mgnify:CR=1 FL=1